MYTNHEVLIGVKNAFISFQDSERKAPPVKYTIEVLEAKPSGIDLKFSSGLNPRTHRPDMYTVTLTPAVGQGKWSSAEEQGNIEYVKQTKLGQGQRVEGMWVESGARSIMVLEFV
jgi:hypothetical protein